VKQAVWNYSDNRFKVCLLSGQRGKLWIRNPGENGNWRQRIANQPRCKAKQNDKVCVPSHVGDAGVPSNQSLVEGEAERANLWYLHSTWYEV
jgi:hypothetical protein